MIYKLFSKIIYSYLPFTRGKNISKESIQEFIKSLDVLSDEDKATLLALTPSSYIGLASRIVEDEL